MLIVLVGAIVSPNLLHRRIAGEAVAITAPGPSGVGDCVTSLPDVGGFISDVEVQLPTATYGPCAGPIVGEIVSVREGVPASGRVPAEQYQQDLSQCALESIGYTGSVPPVVPRSDGGQGLVWSPAVVFQQTSVGPSRVQRSVGQRWSACVVGAPVSRPYDGLLRDALTTGVLPTDFGSCWKSETLRDSDQVACDRPHAVEVLATTGLGSASQTAAEVGRSCRVFAGRMMRTIDPERAGSLSVRILDFRDGATVVTSPADILKDTYLTCVATARHHLQLTGTLIGLGKGPLPTG